MYWNWYTLDACFISTTWHISSIAVFFASCIGVVGLVMLLELLRRLQREYDRLIAQRAQQRKLENESEDDGYTGEDPPHSAIPLLSEWAKSLPLPSRNLGYLPTAPQQAVRALLYTLQLAVAYTIMLLAMYYNGYILVSILIGAFIGSFMFSWEDTGNTNK